MGETWAGSPRTWTDEEILQAAQFNTELRDRLDYLRPRFRHGLTRLGTTELAADADDVTFDSDEIGSQNLLLLSWSQARIKSSSSRTDSLAFTIGGGGSYYSQYHGTRSTGRPRVSAASNAVFARASEGTRSDSSPDEYGSAGVCLIKLPPGAARRGGWWSFSTCADTDPANYYAAPYRNVSPFWNFMHWGFLPAGAAGSIVIASANTSPLLSGSVFSLHGIGGRV